MKKEDYIKKTLSLENINITNDEIKYMKKRKKEKMIKTTKTIYKNWEDYFILGTNTLKNIPGIQNSDELKQLEKEISIQRLAELYNNPIKGNFDLEHLSNIHNYLFDEIYDWAGQIRNVDISKTTNFCPHENIINYINQKINTIVLDIENTNSKEELATKLALLYYHLIYAHPFREGNGRKTREFIRELLNYYDFEFGKFEINFEKLDKSICAMCLIYGPEMSEIFLKSQFFIALEKINNKTLKKSMNN